MRTHGPVVIDAFHRKYLVLRQRDPQLSATGQQLLSIVNLRQVEVEKSPHRIESRDALVCDLIRLNGTMYEDVMELVAGGQPDEQVNAGFALL